MIMFSVRWFPLAFLFLLLSPLPALAGVHAGGVLIAHDEGLTVSSSNGTQTICAQLSPPANLQAVDARIDGADNPDDPVFFGIYAIFPPGASPKLSGVTWGIHFSDGVHLVLADHGSCGDYELNDDNWPQTDTGSSVTWDTAQTSLACRVYYFTAYMYSATPSLFELIPHPAQGGYFGDDSLPAVLDPIAGYGKLGFDMDGSLPAQGGDPGACCDRGTGICAIISAQSCGNNIFKGPGTSCSPDPCGVGACCGLGDFFCADKTRAQCDAVGGVFLGLETSCATSGDAGCVGGRWGACCNGAACVVTELSACGTIWMRDIGCVPLPCAANLGACCSETNCTVRVESDCTGVWLPGTDCVHSTPCNPAPGACCTGQSCQVKIQAQCSGPTSFWLPNQDCSPNRCAVYGACCYGGPTPQTCRITTQSGCSYVWLASQPCSPDLCASPVEKTTWGQIKARYRDAR